MHSCYMVGNVEPKLVYLFFGTINKFCALFDVVFLLLPINNFNKASVMGLRPCALSGGLEEARPGGVLGDQTPEPPWTDPSTPY